MQAGICISAGFNRPLCRHKNWEYRCRHVDSAAGGVHGSRQRRARLSTTEERRRRLGGTTEVQAALTRDPHAAHCRSGNSSHSPRSRQRKTRRPWATGSGVPHLPGRGPLCAPSSPSGGGGCGSESERAPTGRTGSGGSHQPEPACGSGRRRVSRSCPSPSCKPRLEAALQRALAARRE